MSYAYDGAIKLIVICIAARVVTVFMEPYLPLVIGFLVVATILGLWYRHSRQW